MITNVIIAYEAISLGLSEYSLHLSFSSTENERVGGFHPNYFFLA